MRVPKPIPSGFSPANIPGVLVYRFGFRVPCSPRADEHKLDQGKMSMNQLLLSKITSVLHGVYKV